MMPAARLQVAAALCVLIATGSPAAAAETRAPRGIDAIRHILVIYLENHSFDNMFGLFPGAAGLPGTSDLVPQVDRRGQVYAVLPPVPDPRFPTDLPNAPFRIDDYLRLDQRTPDLIHRFYQNQLQIDGGRDDKFATYSNAGGLVMGYYDTRHTKLWRYARQYTLADHFFQGAFGGSFLNHFWLVCACTPKYEAAPEAMRAVVDDKGGLIRDGAVTPDGYAVNTIFSVFQPHPASISDRSKLLPPVTLPNIGDMLSAKHVSWAWYAGGWNDALAGRPAPSFQFHHQPFVYFANYGDGTQGRKEHLKDETDLYTAIVHGSLPAVAFFKPLGIEDQHPGYANITNADDRAADIIARIKKSRLWKSTLIIVTYDENGGFWDHMAPPKGDRWGPGTRVPALIISPLAKRGFVDHTVYDTTSILKLIELRFDLPPLGERDAKAAPLTNALAPN